MEKSDKTISELIRNNDVFIQIGTNTGKDFFREIVFQYKPKLVILVEPNKNLIDEIKYNYQSIDINIENVAIIEEKKEVTLYYPNKENYYHGHFSLLPMDDWGNDLITLKADGVTFESILNKYNISHIDFLCIDTEGYDALILKTINFNEVIIDLVVFENWHFSPEVFKKHNKNWQNLGSVADNEICRILEIEGYKLYEDKYCWYNRIAIK